MDEFGFSSAARLAIELHDMGSRGSGRSMRLIERATKGDLIVTVNEREAARLSRLLKQRDKPDVQVRVLPSNDGILAFQGTLSRGRVWFDHLWLQEFYTNRISRADKDLERLQEAISKTWPESPDQFDREHKDAIKQHPHSRSATTRSGSTD